MIKKLQFCILLFALIAFSCLPDFEPSGGHSTPDPWEPEEEDHYESRGYYLDGQFDGNQILVRDTFITMVSATFGGAGYTNKPDSVTISFGMEFHPVDATGNYQETFQIQFRKKEATAVLDAKHNYLNLSRINDVITTGSWPYVYNKYLLKDKGVSVTYIDQRSGVANWFTDYSEIFDYSTFRFTVDEVASGPDENTLVVKGSFECTVYNYSNPAEQKDFNISFRGPIRFFWN